MDEEKISRQMKEDWDRRVNHDYRFWMSDGYSSDDQMWSSGERDFAIITRDIPNTDQKTILEIGCGVGRLLRPAINNFANVIGIDVSTAALDKAESLLGKHDKLTLIQNDGLSLAAIDENSIDVVLSYASLTSIPTKIIARYLLEANRVLKNNGLLRLQVYLGNEQEVKSDDTLHLRCFTEQNFIKAIEKAGFTVEWLEDLKLPFKVSFEEIGIIARVGSFRKERLVTISSDEIAEALLPGGEPSETQSISGADVECWMSINYAKELAETGDLEHARQTLEYALAQARTTTLDVQDLLQQITETIEKRERALKDKNQGSFINTTQDSSFYEGNLQVIIDRFPDLYRAISSISNEKLSDITINQTKEGPVISAEGQALDHPTAPARGAENWVRGQMQGEGIKSAEHLYVFGFGAGYHLEALINIYSGKLSALEPSLILFKKALTIRDLRGILSRLDTITVGDKLCKVDFEGEAQLLVRPQNQTLFQQSCSEVRAKFYGARGLNLLSPTITVLGPLSGGTLPILGYTVHGLANMKQRVRSIDMSSFAGGFSGIDGLVHNESKLAMARGRYTEAMSDIILDIADEKPMDILICMAQAPLTGKTLTELRNRGVITVLWFVEDYLRFPVWRYMARYYDFIFTIQRGHCLDAIKQAGAGAVHYLPTAADPLVHAPVTLTPEEKKRWGSPVSFVGAGYHNRQQLFATLSNLPFKIWGTEWPNCKPFDRMVQEAGRRLSPEEYVKIFNATDININLHSSTERDGVDPAGDFLNPRTFELAACGAFQLVDHREYLPEAFKEGEEVAVFRDRQEMLDMIDYYLAHPEERMAMAQRARERVFREHTYQHRLNDMLSFIYSSKFEHLKKRAEQSPWAKVLKRAKPHSELNQRCERAFARGEEPNLDGLVADIVSGQGKLSETEQKLLFLFHVRRQMIRMRHEESGK